MDYDIKERVTYTVELTEAEAVLIGFALDGLAENVIFKSDKANEETAEFSCLWDEMIGVDDYDWLYDQVEDLS